jgi:murein DD-endopeptidase MepM/ murein hydrolase activator NlpD
MAATRGSALLILLFLVTIGGGPNGMRRRTTESGPISQSVFPTKGAPIAPPRTDNLEDWYELPEPFEIDSDQPVDVPAAPRKRVSTLPPRNAFRRSAQVQVALTELRARNLVLPMSFLTPADLNDSFENTRSGGTRRHYAIDIPAPVGTPILAVDDGVIIDLKSGGRGGIAVVAADAAGRFIYYYAHLLKYHPSMEPGRALVRGDTIGFVGTSGNASEDKPHLHLAILRASNVARWSSGTPINPAEVWKR